jgi:hypothetical protein
LTMEYLGLAPEYGKAVFLVSTADVADLPGKLKLPCARFGLLLAYDATAADVDQLWETLGRLLDIGCVYLCTWGPRCEFVHDLMDELEVIRDLDDPVDGTVLTTWHDKEPVDEALDLALMLRPHAYYAEGWDAIVIANIGDAADPDELRRLIFARVSPSH